MKNRKAAKLVSAVVCLALLGGLLAGCGKGDDSSASWQPDPSATYTKDDPTTPPFASTPQSSSTQSDAPPSSVPAPSSESSKPPQPAPEFVENTPAVQTAGKTVTVVYKTNVDSTVNAIIATRGDKPGTAVFYDYFNRGIAYDGAVSKKATYSVNSAGKTETYELPDLSKTYYLLVNAVENETGTWQSYITVIPLFNPLELAPYFIAAPTRGTDNGANAVFNLEANIPSKVYALVTAADAAAPTAQQVRDAGSGYGGTTYGSISVNTVTAAPYTARIELPKSSYTAGTYAVWVTMQGTHKADALFSVPVKAELKI